MVGFSTLWTLGLISVCQVLTVNAEDSVPVLLWVGKDKNFSPEPINPFLNTPRAEFEKILNQHLGKPLSPLLVFLKDNLCVEDLIKNKKVLEEMKDAGMMYLPAVESPMSVVENLSSYNMTMEDTDTENGLSIVQVEEWVAIPKYYNATLESSPNLIAILTGKSCIFSKSERVKRESVGFVESKNESLFFKSIDGKTLLYASQYPFIKISNNSDLEQLASISNASNVKRNNNSIILTLIFKTANDPKVTTQFNFTLTRGYFRLNNVLFSNESNPVGVSLKSKNQLFIPEHFSYHCAQNVVFSDINTQLLFKGLQVQLDANGNFGDTYDCIGFTTIPIWTGIFVTAILALIMIWGLTMILDIRTMDRFDDPKGKTITISAQE